MTVPAYTVSLARASDLDAIPRIELAAAQLLVGHAPPSVLAETTSHDDLVRALRRGHLWVALHGVVPVGYARAAIHDRACAHLEEVDVDPAHGRRGLGTRLVAAVCQWAAASRHEWVTLTTFRDVPWNMPFYIRLGFEVMPAEAMSAVLRGIVDDEARRGLDPRRRVAMRMRVGRR